MNALFSFLILSLSLACSLYHRSPFAMQWRHRGQLREFAPSTHPHTDAAGVVVFKHARTARTLTGTRSQTTDHQHLHSMISEPSANRESTVGFRRGLHNTPNAPQRASSSVPFCAQIISFSFCRISFTHFTHTQNTT
uniref:Putative secreted protein n=1 Tax=Anopheles darlingi TaxID=43151 RepID=A0A2M4D2B9_ANODA